MAQFEQALKKLIDDRAYREAVIREPNRLGQDYADLEAHDMLLLMQVWHATDPGGVASIGIIDMCHCCCSVNQENNLS